MSSTETRAAALTALLILMTLSPLWGLSFDEILPAIDSSRQVTEARLAARTAAVQYRAALFAGDAALSLSPGVNTVSRSEGEFAEQKELTASLSTVIPAGLTPAEKAAAAGARAALELAERELDYARYSAYASLFEAYSNAYLARMEVRVLEAELSTAREEERSVRRLFESGSATLQELNRADDDLKEAESASLQGELAARLSWLTLAYAAGLNQAREEELEPLEVTFPALPKPPELSSRGVERSPVLIALRNQIASLRGDTRTLQGAVLPPVLKASFSGWDQSGSLSYNLADPEIGFSYSLPLMSIGPDLAASGSGSSSDETWQLGFSVSIPFRSGGSDTLSADLNESRISETEASLRYAAETMALQIRASYQQYILAEEAVLQASRSLEFARSTLETVSERRKTARATPAEELAARAQLERAIFRRDQAVSGKENAALRTAGAAFSLDEFIPWE